MGLTSMNDDVLTLVLSYLDVAELLRTGATNVRHRRSSESNALWAPICTRVVADGCYDAQPRLGLSSAALDDASRDAVLRLAPSLRRLYLQCLPWRPGWGRWPTSHGALQGALQFGRTAWGWRPPHMPRTLRQPPSAAEWFFVEVYTTDYDEYVEDRRPYGAVTRPAGDYGHVRVRKAFASKVVRLEACSVRGFPGAVFIPLDIDAGDRENNYMATMDVRVLAMIGGVVVPVADTCWFAGEADARWLHIPWDGGDDLCSGSLHFSISMDIDVGAMPSTFKSLTLSWEEYNAGGDPVAEPDEYGAKLTLLDGLRGLRTFYERPKAWSDTFRPIDVLTSDDEHNGERHELASDFVRKKGPSLDRPDGGEVDFTRRRPRPGARLA